MYMMLKKCLVIPMNSFFSPLGGSLVTLTAFCKTDTGKDFVGMEERKSLKSSWMNESGDEKPLTIFSIDNIQEAARWQF